ncbi:Ig-like domain-containing protein [Pseudomonas fluorescens]|uniref:Ig-like domain-containing protein n=1 Tax=Pseudomonas fluorescens TaxID=294 RepID=UPI001A9CC767|nr:Ig-like domain-containing protein [Pseudomonas fluorescens]QTD31476.1 hypothetical protein JZM58_19505 [Pseudomonas fluorescens]
MNPSAVNIAVVDGKTITEAVDLSTVKAGKPVRIKAIEGGKYILAEGEKGVAPENITIKRVGKDLHLSLEGSDEPQLIIEGFYEHGGQLVGVAEDGAYYEYVSSDAEKEHEPAFLMDNDSSALVLGADKLVGFGDGLVAVAGAGWFLPALLGLGALGLAGAAFAIGKSDGGGGGSDNRGGGLPPQKPAVPLAGDDVGSITGPITKGGSTDDKTPTFSGIGQPGNKVEVWDNGAKIGEAVVKDDGTWTFTPEKPLPEGAHNIVVVEVGPGGTSEPSDGFDFIIDTVAPGKSKISDAMDDVGTETGSIASGGRTDDARPTLSGEGEPGSRIDIYDNGKKIGEAMVGADGKWTYTPDADLADGTHVLTTVAVDAAGNAGLPSDPYTIVVATPGPDVTPPEKGSIGSVVDNSGDQTGPIENGGSTDDSTPTFGGGGRVPGDIVTIIDNNTGLPIGSTVVDDNGNWTYTPENPLPEGTNEIVVVVKDPAGNEGEPSDPWIVVVDTTAPVQPTIGSVQDNQGDQQGELKPGDTTDDAQPEFSGVAEEGSIVYISDNGVVIGSVVAGPGGVWNYTPIPPLAPGEHSISVVAKDPAGNMSEPSDPFKLEVTTGGTPPAPAILGVTDNVGDNAGENISPITGVTDDLRPTIHGSAEPGSTVYVYADGVLIGSGVADAVTGLWSVDPILDLPQGVNNITAKSVNSAGNEGAETGAYPITVDNVAPGVATQQLMDDVGTTRGPILDGTTTDDNSPTFTGTAEPGSIVFILDNGVVIGSAKVFENGSWSFTPSPALADGNYAFSTIVQDGAGNQSAESDRINFSVDTRPVEISISHITDDAGTVQDPVSSGGVTDDATPTLHGLATPNSVVNVYLDGRLVGTAVSGADGKWEYPVSPALTDGPHTFFAKVVTGAGESDASGNFNLNIDTTAPEVGEPGQPGGIGDILDDVGNENGATESIGNGGQTNDPTPTLTGTGRTPGEIIHIFQNGQEVGSVEVQANGTWAYTPFPALNDDTYDFTIKVEDQAGNLSAESDPYTITIDTQAPIAPTLESIMDDQGDAQGNLVGGPLNPATDDDQPTFGGKAEPGSTVYIYDNGVVIGSVKADETTGIWSFTPNSALSAGPHSISVTAVDAAGNVSPPTSAFDFFVVSGGAPNVPAILGVTDDVGSIVGNVAKDTGVTDDLRPDVNGTGEPGTVISLYINDVFAGSATVLADGTWTITPIIDLTEGLNSITAKATNAAGNESETGSYDITLDTSAPAQATSEALTDNVGNVVGPISNGDTTDDNTPTFNGKGEPGSTVYIYDTVNGVVTLIGSEKVDANGDWTFTPKTPLADGPHSLHTVVQDAAGNQSAPGTPIGFTVDTTAVVVSIESARDNEGTDTGPLASGDVTDDTTPSLSGEATPNSYVNIYLNGALVGTANVGADGKWTYYQTPALTADGIYRYTAAVVTAVGESAQTAEFILELDTTAPEVGGPGQPGGIGDILDDVGNENGATESVENGGVTNDPTPTLIGSGREPGEIIHIIDNGTEIGTAVVKDDGTWSFTPETGRVPGEHQFVIRVEDEAGNLSGPSDPYIITVDVTAPAAPILDSVMDDQGDVTGNLLQQGANPQTDDDQPTFGGRAEPGSTVYIYDNGVVIGSVKADPTTGVWSFTPLPALAIGDHSISVAAKDAAGNLGEPSTPFDFSIVSGGAPSLPAILGVTDDVGNVTGHVEKDTGVTDDLRPDVHGTGEPDTVISLYINGVFAGSATVLADGTWTITPTIDLTEGLNSITAKATNAAGNESETGSYDITLDTSAPAQATSEALTDNVGNVVGPISNGDTTDDNTPTFSGQGEPGSIVFIYDTVNGVVTLIGSEKVDANGDWTFTPKTPLADGPHSLHTVVQDAAGNQSAPGTPIGFTVDTTAVVVSIEYAGDNVGSNQDNLASGDVTDDTTPTLHGEATPNSTVNIYRDGALVGTATVGANGKWSFIDSTLTADGTYRYTAKAVTAAGESPETAEFVLTLDTTAPEVGGPGQPGGIGDILDDVGNENGATESIGNGGQTNDPTPTLIGSGREPGEIIHIIDNGTEIGTAKVDENGNWTFTPETGRVPGEHEFVIRVEDEAGNLSEPSDPYVVNIDVMAPDAPILDSVMDDQGDVTGNVMDLATPLTDDDQPTFGGTAEPGSTVYIYDNGVVIGSVKADATTGVWSYTPNPALAIGDHSISVAAKDAAGNLGEASDAFDFSIVSGGAPNAPAILGVTDNVGDNAGENVSPGTGVTDDLRPVVNGTGEPDTVISLYINGVFAGSATVLANGTWTITPTIDLTEGLNSITAKATNAAGNESDPTGNYDITLDTTAPAPVTLEELTDNIGNVQGEINNGDTTDDNTPTFSGEGEPNSIVFIYDTVNGVATVIGSVQVDSNGDWTFTPRTPLADGPHSLHTVVQDAAGNQSEPSTPIGFTVDTRAVEISIEYAADNEGSNQDSLASGDVTDDTTPTLHGEATPNSYVNIYRDGTLIGTANVGADGKWNYTDSTLTTDDTYRYTAAVVTAAGGESPQTAEFILKLDTTAPEVGGPGEAGGIGDILDDVGNENGATESIENGGVTNDTTPTLIGSGREPGEIIHIIDGETEIGTAVVKDDGTWSFTPETGRAPGEHQFVIRVEDAAGNLSAPSDPYIVTIDVTGPAAPNLVDVLDNVGGMIGDLLDQGANPVTDDNQPEFKGTAEANSIVYFTDTVNGVATVIGSAQVDANGNWTYIPDPALAAGQHSISVSAEDAAGNMGTPSSAFDFSVVAAGPATRPDITGALDSEGENAGTVLPNGSVTDDKQPVIRGTGNADDIVTLYQGSQVVGSARVASDGTWEIPLTVDLAEGANSFTAKAVNGAGNESEESAAFNIELDTTPPDVANPGEGGIGIVYDDFGNPGGGKENIANGGVTNDTSPEITGTGRTFGEIVHVYRDNQFVGTATVLANGSWSFFDANLVDGETYGYTIKVQDAAGNVGGESTESYNITVDTTAPDKPTIGTVVDNNNADGSTGNLTDGGSTDDTTPTFSGKAEPDSIVYFFDGTGTTPIGSAQVNASGDWTYEPTLGVGNHSITVKSKDAAGNYSEASDAFDIEVVATKPPIVSGGEDFEGTPEGTTPGNNELVTQHGLRIKTSRYGISVHDNEYHNPDQGNAIIGLPGGKETNVFTFPGLVEEFSFQYTFVASGSMMVRDKYGSLIEYVEVPASGTVSGGKWAWSDFKYTAPPGKEIGSFTFSVVNHTGDPSWPSYSFWMDDFKWGERGSVRSVDSNTDSYSLDDAGELATLAFSSDEEQFDLSKLSQADAARDIDVIDLTNNGNNTLKLSVNDILSHGEADLFQDSGKVQLKVEGDEGDIVELQGLIGNDPGEWVAQGQITSGGKVYEVYQHSSQNAELLVEQGVQTNLV